jgi:hypothetical protein
LGVVVRPHTSRELILLHERNLRSSLMDEPTAMNEIASLFVITPVGTRSLPIEYLLEHGENATQALRLWVAEQAFDPALVGCERARESVYVCVRPCA